MNSFTSADICRDGCERWVPWPAFEDHSAAYYRLINALQHDRGALVQCIATADRVTAGDDASWYREWHATAESSVDRAELAFAMCDRDAAGLYWLRASQYFRAAETFLTNDDPRRASVIENMRACSRKHIELLQPRGEVVSIPQTAGPAIEGYFIPAPDACSTTPVVLCIGGWEDFKDGYLSELPRYAGDRGLSLLLVEPPRMPAASGPSRLGRFSVATAISDCIDHLCSHAAVDREAIAVYGLRAGASFATETAATDGRIKAVVCDGGALALRRRAVAFRQLAGDGSLGGIEQTLDRLRGHVRHHGLLCPALITSVAGDADGVEADCWSGPQSLGVFSIDRDGVSPVTILDPSASNGYIFDWIAAALARTAMLPQVVAEAS